LKTAWRIAKRSITEFVNDDAMNLGGALAFYTALSMAPLLILVLAIAGFVWQTSDVQAEVIRQVQSLIGKSGAETAESIMHAGGKEQAHGIAAIVGIVTLVFGATGVFAQLQASLNRIWNVEHKPGRGVWDFIRKRLLSLGMILAIAFLLLVSLLVSAALGFISGSRRIELPGGDTTWAIIDLVISLLVYSGIFTAIHRFLPDVKITWKQALVGGVFTAILFAIGKELLGWYLGQGSVSSPYGAAGSLLVVLVWVYYSSLILFLGAEVTQAFVLETGDTVQPEDHARRITPKQPAGKPEPAGASGALRM
jgi:membrane protein